MGDLFQAMIDNHEEIRSLALAFGAIIALIVAPIGLLLNFRRTKQIQRQNDLTEAFQKTNFSKDEAKSLRENFSFAMKELSSDVIYRRQSAIVLLSEATQEPLFRGAALAAVSGFVTRRSQEEKNQLGDEQADDGWMPEDILFAVRFIKDTEPEDAGRFRRHIVLKKAFLPYAGLYSDNLSNSDISSSDFSSANFSRGTLKEPVAVGTTFDNARFRSVDLTGADLRGASFRSATIRKSKLYRANISGADFRGAKIPMVTLTDERREEIASIVPEESWVSGNTYCQISAAQWDPDNPPSVDGDIAAFIEQKTFMIRQWISEKE